MWYHYTCVGLPKDLKLEKVKYKCIGCALRQGTLTPPAQTDKAETPDPSDPTQTEIETLLLDFFITKKRISLQNFEFVVAEGHTNIPLKLEEIPSLMYMKDTIDSWKTKVSSELTKCLNTRTLVTNFKQINMSKSKSDHEIAQVQREEKAQDDRLFNLVI